MVQVFPKKEKEMKKEMKKDAAVPGRRSNRRSFLKNGMVAAGAMSAGVGLVSSPAAFASNEDDHAPVTKGDIAVLTFLSALEQVEADLWIQYAELGGATSKVPTSIGLSPIDLKLNRETIVTGRAPAYITGLQVLDTDMPQYIVDNTDDEISHHRFLNNYLASKGAKTIDLSPFAILPPSRVKGVPQTGRLTNLKQLTVDTTFWTRYRSATLNPDLGGKFENAVPDLAKGQHPAIPVSDDDLVLDKMGNISTHLQAIANTAGFHFCFIEQGGSSLYPTLAQKVTNLEVLQILLSIGPSETMHFQVWHDKAGNAQVLTDGALSFPDLNSGTDPNPNGTATTQQEAADSFQTNLIMPEPTFFLHKGLGPVSIIRPTTEAGGGGAVSAVVGFVDDGLFIDPATGKNSPIVAKLMALAEEADEARRSG
jgi:Ferritin-like domain